MLPVEVQAAELTSEGLRFDRQYLIIQPPTDPDATYAEHFTIKTQFSLCLLQPVIDETWSRLTIKHVHDSSKPTLNIPLTPSPISLMNAKVFHVSVFGTKASGVDMGDSAADFLTDHMGTPARLIYIAGSGRRDIPGAAYEPNRRDSMSLAFDGAPMQPQRIRFADAAPLLISSSASEEDTRQRLPPQHRNEDIIIRFRSNIHFKSDPDTPPFDEDSWKLLRILPNTQRAQAITVKCIFKCVRCLSLNVDFEKGGMVPTRRQVYGLLARDRRVNEAFPRKVALLVS